MNLSRPIVSAIEGVSFGALSSSEIKSLSAKRIVNPTAIDPFLHPVPGGLYDLALGAFLDNSCTTCRLDRNSCPGHCGHIELPVPVYHCAYMDQAYRLIRAQCRYCFRFKMSRIDVDLFWCKLRLIRYGLLVEARELDNIGIKRMNSSTRAEDGEDSELSAGEEQKQIIEQRRTFVKRAIKRRTGGTRYWPFEQSEVVSGARKSILKEFHAAILTRRTCANCKAVNPTYRREGSTKIFRRPLNAKDLQKNRQNGIKAPLNPLTEIPTTQKGNRKAKQAGEQQIHEVQVAFTNHEDEGVADLENNGLDETQIEFDAEVSDSDDNLGVEDGNGFLSTEAGTKQKKQAETEQRSQVYLNSSEVYAALCQLFIKEFKILGVVYASSLRDEEDVRICPDIFFVKDLLVPPNRYRKESQTGPMEISESPDNDAYRKVILACDELFSILKDVNGTSEHSRYRKKNYDDLQDSWINLQGNVNALFDDTKSEARGYAMQRLAPGIKQKLEKKEGMFRMNIMGKRVNFAARSVISPDPNIEASEVGIPPVFAKKLTYPEPVTPHAFDELKQAVINGANIWPGAAAVEYENGQVMNLRYKSADERQAIANLLLAPSSTNITGVRNKKVYRHLNNGDIVLMNRQPTLHKPSMMAHRAKILPGEKTIRMHYANCNTYNADFDGDEMNLHFPQNEIARAEALQIANTENQYLSATAGKPLRGLIQDHISIAVWLTCLDTFFSKDDYQELLYSCLRPEDDHTTSGRILTIDPALIKPRQMWTGKQIITTILLNIKPESHDDLFLTSKSQTPAERWAQDSSEGIVLIQGGFFVHGILDKAQIGPSAGGLIHAVYETYGPITAGKLIAILGRLLTRLLNMRAFSCGVEDLLLTEEGNSVRLDRLKEADNIGVKVAARYVSLDTEGPQTNTQELRLRLEEVLRDDDKQAGLDVVTNAQSKNLSSEITSACLPEGLYKPFPRNQMQAMTTTGAKGSGVNANLISCNLGQQVLEGRRVPIMVSGKTLPSFRPFDSSLRAGGYITDRFLTGVKPQEYFFHAMAGREGLIDTAVKTSRSGYLQRCLVKGLEGLRSEYDGSVRDADGTIIQALYGEDGLEIVKQQMLMNFDFLGQNFMSLFASLNMREDLGRTKSVEAEEWNKNAIKMTQRSGDLSAMDTALSCFNPHRYAGSTSEKFFMSVREYVEKNPQKLLRDKKRGITGFIRKEYFRDLLNMNYMKSLVQAGEAVGVVAAQSIGEPSTQMTLNTFHLAGHAAKNVTLGIPRLREILMTASLKIKTPTMILHPIPELPAWQFEAFAKGTTRLSLAQILDKTQVKEDWKINIGSLNRVYTIRLDFFPATDYKKEHGVSITDVANTIEGRFLPILLRLVKVELKRKAAARSLRTAVNLDSHPDIGKSADEIAKVGVQTNAQNENVDIPNEGGNSDEDEGGDDDATVAKMKSNLDGGVTYEDPDEDEQAIANETEDENDESEASEFVDEAFGGSEDEASPEILGQRDADLETRIIDKFAEISALNFNSRTGRSCKMVLEYPSTTPKFMMLSLVKRAAHNALIQHIQNITEATIIEENTKAPYILASGVNIEYMREKQQFLNPHRIFTNDIGQMLLFYGVEAARETIVRELQGVFEGHSIKVNHRHLTLVADYMTRGGGFSPFSRHGMSDKANPFAKMSFESTVGFLKEAVTDGDVDDLTSPSARITVGKLNRMGTGMFDVLTPVG